MRDNPYIGKITNAGSQVVNGNAKQAPKGKTIVQRGNDLRNGRGSARSSGSGGR